MTRTEALGPLVGSTAIAVTRPLTGLTTSSVWPLVIGAGPMSVHVVVLAKGITQSGGAPAYARRRLLTLERTDRPGAGVVGQLGCVTASQRVVLGTQAW